MKPTEILLDLSDLKLGRIIKKDFEEVIADISAIAKSTEAPKSFETSPRVKGAEVLPVKGVESPKAGETKFRETATPVSPTVYK